MAVAKRRGFVWTMAWLSGTGLTAAALGVAAMNAGAGGGLAIPADASQPKLNANLIYLGNAGCGGGTCHSGEAKMHSGQMVGDEKTIFERQDPPGDPHANAFMSLTEKMSDDKFKPMAAVAGVGDPATSARCVSCHAMDAPKKGPKFGKLADNAVGCESCHGPYEKAEKPHQKEGWMDGLRAKGNAAVEAEGLHDTRNLAVRGAGCVSCHLALDKDLIDAGHPELRFEMWWYNVYKERGDENNRIHWTEQKDKTQTAKIWAVGQLVSLTAAKANVANWKEKKWDTAKAEALEKVYAAGAAIVKAQFGTDDANAFASQYKAGVELDGAKVKAALADLMKFAATVKDGADNASARTVVNTGVEALVRATGGKPDKGAAKTRAGGDDWLKSLEAIAAMAK
jgi:hypothetical protein